MCILPEDLSLHTSSIGIEFGLEIKVEPGVVRMAGEIDVSNVHVLAAGLTSAVAQDHRLVLDLSDVGFIDLAGTRQLVEHARQCRPDEVRVLGAPRALAVILRVGGWAGEVKLVGAKEKVLQ